MINPLKLYDDNSKEDNQLEVQEMSIQAKSNRKSESFISDEKDDKLLNINSEITNLKFI